MERQKRKKVLSVKNKKKFVYTITIFFVLLFAILVGYLTYFTASKRSQISVHPNNRRLDHLEAEMIRGDIYDTNKNLLATSEGGSRTYPYGKRYAHAVGYSQRGKSGAEALANTELLYPDYNVVSIFENAFQEKKFEGRDVVLTLDDRLQKAAERGLEGYKGAAVVIEPTTGKIKVMYANPAFDPNDLVNDWEDLIQDDENSPLVNRSTQGLYPPGSTFKVVTTIAYLEKMKDVAMDFSYNCTGEIRGDDFKIQCYNKRVHGNVNLQKAFEQSCNTYFVKLTEMLGAKELENTAVKLGFNAPLQFDMESTASQFKLTANDTPFEKGATYIGQGKTLVTPLHMAMIASTIANDGILMKPYIFDYSMSKSGKIKNKHLPQYTKALIDEKTANTLETMMLDVVKNGTGQRLSRGDLTVAGKTGTAQNETGMDHSWFMGFAKYPGDEQYGIAFAVVVENGGEGSKALNVVNRILDNYISIKE